MLSDFLTIRTINDLAHARTILERAVTSKTVDLVIVAGFGTLYARAEFTDRIRALSEQHNVSVVHLP